MLPDSEGAAASLLLPQACQAALAIDGGMLEATKDLVRAMLAAKRLDEAVNLARNALQQHQSDGEVHEVNSAATTECRQWFLCSSVC